MADRIDVFVSSTARDLPEHRKQVMDACLRQGMFPIMMEHLPASGADAIRASLKMVDEAEIYLGIFGFRYGYVPAGYDISITQMEYEHAVERGIPRLIFLMHDDHPVKPSDIETDDNAAARLEALRERLMVEQVVNFFHSPEELRALVINSLSLIRRPDIASFHYISDIPQPPEPYIAHPYTLLQTGQIVGRQNELNLLTAWVTQPSSPVYAARLFNFVAIGGMGKSALTWKWFNDIVPQEMKPLAGRLWWSFYESDAHFENFIIRALAYVSRRPREEVEKLPPAEREAQLLAILDREPFLLVLDGLERILIAYARMDAAHLSDSDYDQQTANFVAGAMGLPASAAQSFTGQHRLRKTADPRAGLFLRKLANVRAARILISTRLYPADLQTVSGDPVRGAFAVFLKGLNDDDAVNLWREFGVSGSREELLGLFHTFDNYPLLIRALAGLVAEYKRAPGDFDAWRKANPDFNPFHLELRQVQSHVLSFAMQDLSEQARHVLHTIAAFRMPAVYDTLTALMVRPSLKNQAALNNVAADHQQAALKLIMQIAPELGPHQGDPAGMLWVCLRYRRLENIDFQQGVAIPGTAITADFLAPDAKLVLELVDEADARPPEVHERRRQELEALGYHLLQISRQDVVNALGLVLARISAVALPLSGQTGTRIFENEHELDLVLSELEDRGLLGWDRRANRYDLHPIVRGVTWSGLDTTIQKDVYHALHAHFEAIPRVDQNKVERIEELTPAIELYNTLIGLGRYDDACDLFYDRLADATLYRLSASRQRAELLALLFPDGLDRPPRLRKVDDQTWTLNALATAYHAGGQPGRAVLLYHSMNRLIEEADPNDRKGLSTGLRNLSDALRLSGALYEAEYTARHALAIDRERNDPVREATSLNWLGLTLSVRGSAEGPVALARAVRIDNAIANAQSQCVDVAYLAQDALWRGDFAAAREWADKSWQLALHARYERDLIMCARRQGAAALGLGDLATAEERLHHALTRARAVNDSEEELQALIALAELRRQQGRFDEARHEYLDGVWEAAERGPYPLSHADALNVLAQIEYDLGDRDAAVEAATRAYELSWCDGPPYAYHWGLQRARQHLEELGAPLPRLAPFSPAQRAPLPQVEIDPQDDFNANRLRDY